eukprot:jgi/Ulvmu1/7281/UM035_0069.1
MISSGLLGSSDAVASHSKNYADSQHAPPCQDALVSSPRQTRLGQRQMLMQLLATPHKGPGDVQRHNMHASKAAGAATAACIAAPGLPRERQTALSQANQVLGNPTLATQLVIGCYAALHKAKGAVIEGAARSMKTLHHTEREVITQQQQLMHVRHQIDRVRSACQQERDRLQRAIEDKAKADAMQRRCVRRTAELCNQTTSTKEAMPGVLQELLSIEHEQAEQQHKSQELDEVLGMLVSRTPRRTRPT